MLDTLIKNGLIITGKGRQNASIGIEGERIAGVYEPGSEPDADNVIDASGLVILPGGIDMHSHHRQGAEPGG
ncbi:MAG: dihydroorotase, partial [Gammaproteobacteria bacterium]|nr:dihydroorotase [Gammaproteobacteria bacterium]